MKAARAAKPRSSRRVARRCDAARKTAARRSSSSGVPPNTGLGFLVPAAQRAQLITCAPPRSLSPVGKRALLEHKRCMGVLRHHARATGGTVVGTRCSGALAAMQERRSVGAAPTLAGAVGAAHEGHLMIS